MATTTGDNPITGANGLTTEHAAAAVVIGALAFLVLINRGFRPGIAVRVR